MTGSRRVTDGSVLISNGHGKFHLIYAAQGAHEFGLLDRLITGAYPTSLVRRWITPVAGFTESAALRRWLMRRVEGVNDEKIWACHSSEVWYQLAALASHTPLPKLMTHWLDAIALLTYRRAALRYVRRSPARVYHCRAGYGGVSISEARRRGKRVVVDHSIAAPHALSQMVSCQGRYVASERPPLLPMWTLVQQDIEVADLLLVNSDFVKRTLVDFGVDPGRIVVLYWGLDSEMESYLNHDPIGRSPAGPEVRFLFAGAVGKRKGADLLLRAFARVNAAAWRLTLAGPIEADVAKAVAAVRDPRVQILGPVLRDELARVMLSNHVLVFPSLAEGSARVVLEAMAAGMAVVTTPNAGSVVVDRVHGLLVQPGSVESIVHAVETLLGPQRDQIPLYGAAARALIMRDYHSGVYKAKLVA